jgi:hypothetical protein
VLYEICIATNLPLLLFGFLRHTKWSGLFITVMVDFSLFTLIQWSVYLWLCSPFDGPWPLLSFLILYTVYRTPWKGDRLFARPLPTHRTTQTHNKRTQTSRPRVEFEPTTPAFERAKTVQASDRVATVIGTDPLIREFKPYSSTIVAMQQVSFFIFFFLSFVISFSHRFFLFCFFSSSFLYLFFSFLGHHYSIFRIFTAWYMWI